MNRVVEVCMQLYKFMQFLSVMLQDLPTFQKTFILPTFFSVNLLRRM